MQSQISVSSLGTMFLALFKFVIAYTDMTVLM